MLKKVEVTQRQLEAALSDLFYGPPKDDLDAAARPVPTLKPYQEQVIRQILSGHDVLAILPTGSGKSVCYQIPAMYLPGVTLVVTPLLALMEDQVRKLKAVGYPVACLSSDLVVDKYSDPAGEGKGQKEDGKRKRRPSRNALFQDIYREREEGYPNYKLLYVTPERLRDGRFIRFAQRIHISMIAVDEAHCVSLWGYDFRPRYLEIFRLVRRLGYRPILAAFTATATPVVQADITAFLNLRPHPDLVIGDSTAPRENLRFSVRHFARSEDRLPALLEELRARQGQCGYVFCASVDGVNKVYDYLSRHDVPVTRYYADLDRPTQAKERQEGESKAANLQSFLEGKTPVMVCTTALGMGIDKADVRFAIHYNLPLCLENYYQEAGRAGRDGRGADCILFYLRADAWSICHKLIQNTLEENELPPQERRRCEELAHQRLAEMVQYAQGGLEKDPQTLQEEILSYFHRDDAAMAQEAAQRRAETLGRLRAIDVLYVNSTKVAHQLRQGHMQRTDLPIGAPTARLDAHVPTISYQVTGEKLDYFDLMIADAVYTLMSHRRPTIRAGSVMALLSGNSALRLHPQRERLVNERIRKMMRAHMVIDRTKAATYGFIYGPRADKRVLEGPFLPLWEKGSGFGYDPAVLPPLYELAEILGGQFFSLPAWQLHVEGLTATDAALRITHYLLVRINIMSPPDDRAKLRHATRQRPIHNPAVSLEKMLKSLGLPPPRDRQATLELRGKVEAILRHLRAQGAIHSFALPLEGELSRLPLAVYRHPPLDTPPWEK